MQNEINPTEINQNTNPTIDEDGDYRPNDIPENHGWFETCRDWIGEGRLDGIEGNIGIKLSCFGHTREQYELIHEIMDDLTAEARELIPKLIKRRARQKKALLKKST
jgi:hypothetical protein